MPKLIIRAITVHRPWGIAIAQYGKNIENRTWRCWLQPGDFIAIHNGAKFDATAVKDIQQITGIYDGSMNPVEDPAGAIIAIAKFQGNITESNSPWFCGPIGWELSDVIPIEPVYCKGAQGLWTIPEDVLMQAKINFQRALLGKVP